jgi:hypothetical protein
MIYCRKGIAQANLTLFLKDVFAFLKPKGQTGKLTQLTSAMMAVLMLGSISEAARAHYFDVTYSDADGEGVNDPTPVEPLDSNVGETLGEQRRIAIEHALELFSLSVHSDARISIEIDIQQAGDYGAFALINKSSFEEETVIGDIDGKAAGEYDWWIENTRYNFAWVAAKTGTESPALDGEIVISEDYDYDLSTEGAAQSTNLTQVVLHELGHVFGIDSEISTVSDPDSGIGEGVFLNGDPTYFDRLLVDNDGSSLIALVDMTDEERYEASDSGNVQFNGELTKAAGFAEITSGASDEGHPEMHTYDGGERDGQALSHLSESVSPDQMLSSNGALTYDMGMAAFMLADMGLGSPADFELTVTESGGEVSVIVDNPSEYDFENAVLEINVPEDITVSNFAAEPGVCTDAATGFIECEFAEILAFDMIRVEFEAALEGDATGGVIDMAFRVNSLHVDRDASNNISGLLIGSLEEEEPEEEPPVVAGNGGGSNGGCSASLAPQLFNQAYASTGGAAGTSFSFLFIPFLMGAIRKVRQSKMNRVAKFALLGLLGMGLLACGGGSGGGSGPGC